MTDDATSVGRRAVLGGAAAAIASPLVAACAQAAPVNTGPAVPAGSDLGSTSQVPVGSGKIFTSANVVVTQPTAGDFKCFSATCTHRQCQVSQVSGDRIICGCHGSEFSIKDGSVLNPPANRPLPGEKVSVKGGQIILG